MTDVLALVQRHGRDMQAQRDHMDNAVTKYGEFYSLGRRVLLTFEDSGCRTHQDPALLDRLSPPTSRE